jgi:hypothetical protein
MDDDEEAAGTGSESRRSTPSKILKSVEVMLIFPFPRLAPNPVDPDPGCTRFRVGVLDSLAKAMKAFLGFERLIRSLALLRVRLCDEPLLDEEEEEEPDRAPFRKAGEFSIRGCSSCGAYSKEGRIADEGERWQQHSSARLTKFMYRSRLNAYMFHSQREKERMSPRIVRERSNEGA